MPRGRGKGGKNRKKAKNFNVGSQREITFKEEGQEYAQVLKMLGTFFVLIYKGNGRLEAYCFDGRKRLAHIRGKMKNRVWINSGDIILLGLRDFQDDKCDVIMKYHEDEARALKAYGELPESVTVNEGEFEKFEDDGLVFEKDAGEGEEGDEEAEKKDRKYTISDDDEESSEEEEVVVAKKPAKKEKPIAQPPAATKGKGKAVEFNIDDI